MCRRNRLDTEQGLGKDRPAPVTSSRTQCGGGGGEGPTLRGARATWERPRPFPDGKGTEGRSMTDPDESEVEGLTEVTVPANIEREDLIRHVRALYALVGLLYQREVFTRDGEPMTYGEIIKEAFDAAERWESEGSRE